MKQVDCIWELANIGKRTVEIEFSPMEKVNLIDVRKAINGFEYAVVKIPAGNIKAQMAIQKLGFRFIETQMKISKTVRSFPYDDKLLRLFFGKVSIEIIDAEEGLLQVLDSMTPSMFSTDRICLDPEFGPEIGLQRYRNWIISEFHRGSVLYEIKLENSLRIGFSLFRLVDDNPHLLLGGIYEKYQNMGYGILTASSIFFYREQYGLDFQKVFTAISSNNFPVIQLYNYLNFRVDTLSYVFVNHL